MDSAQQLDLGGFLFLRLVVAVSMAALGALIAISFKKISHLGLCLLISFAAGALLAVAVFDIIPESLQLVGWKAGLAGVVLGYALFSALTKFVFHVCPACSATHTELNFKALTLTMMVTLGVHSFMDGLAIYSGCLVTSGVGVLILIAVAYHKLPEGMALALVARNSGMSRSRSLAFSVGMEASTTIAGGLVGFLTLVPGSSHWVGVVLGVVAGGFLYVVLHALLSEAVKHHPRSSLAAVLAGALSIGLAAYGIGIF